MTTAPHATLAVDLVISRWNTDADCKEYLLVRRKYNPFAGHLALPGGLVEAGETIREAAARELFEETSVRCLPAALKLLGEWSDPGRDPRGRVVSVAFMLELGSDVTAMAGDDAAAVTWLSLEEIDPINLAFDHGDILQAAVRESARQMRNAATQWTKEEREAIEAQRAKLADEARQALALIEGEVPGLFSDEIETLKRYLSGPRPPLKVNRLPPLDPLLTRDDARVPVWALLLKDLRNKGWSVAVHNDYRQDGQPMTFWLFAHPSGHWIKGEGANDYEALLVAQDAAARLPVPTPYGPSASEAVFGFASWLSSRKEAVTFSEVHDAARPAELAGTYCDAQGFAKPRLGIYPNNLKRMGENQ